MRPVLGAVLALGLTTLPASAQSWRLLGPPSIHGIVTGAADQGHLYGHDGSTSLLSSTDAGLSWFRLGHLPAGSVTALGVAPDDSSVLGAAVSNLDFPSTSRFFLSTDGGSTWSARGGLPHTCSRTNPVTGNECPCAALAIGPAPHESVVATSSAAIFVSLGQFNYYNPGWGALRSKDGGWTWSPPAYPASEGFAIATSDDGSVLHVSSWTGTLTSTDAGATWRSWGEQAFAGVWLAPASPCNAVAGDTASRVARVQVTPDCGASSAIGDGTPFILGIVPAVAASRSHTGAFLAAFPGSLQRSDDGGMTWRPLAHVPCSLGDVTEIVRIYAPTERFLVRAASGLWELALDSAPWGSSWSPCRGVPLPDSGFPVQKR